MKIKYALIIILFILGLSLTASQIGLVNAATNSSNLITSPITSPTPTPKPGKLPPCGNYGDVNGDGVVTSVDAQMIANYVVGNITLTNQQKLAANVSGDAVLNIFDAMFIAQYITGQRTTFPVCSSR